MFVIVELQKRYWSQYLNFVTRVFAVWPQCGFNCGQWFSFSAHPECACGRQFGFVFIGLQHRRLYTNSREKADKPPHIFAVANFSFQSMTCYQQPQARKHWPHFAQIHASASFVWTLANCVRRFKWIFCLKFLPDVPEGWFLCSNKLQNALIFTYEHVRLQQFFMARLRLP